MGTGRWTQSSGGNRGVNSVVGVVLLLAIVTALAGTVGILVLDFGGKAETGAPSFAPLESYGHRPTANGEYLNVTHRSGESLRVEKLTVTVTDAVVRRVADDSRVDTAVLDGDVLRAQVGATFDASETITFSAEQFVEGSTGNAVGANEYLDLGKADVRIVWADSDEKRSQTVYEWHGPEN